MIFISGVFRSRKLSDGAGRSPCLFGPLSLCYDVSSSRHGGFNLETGIVFDIKRFAIHDGPGIRTTVFFKGCPLRCGLCHNPESQAAEPERMVRPERCLGCGECIAACRSGAISLVKGIPRFEPSLCLLCGSCREACGPEAAETIGKRMTVEQVMDEIARDLVFYDESGGGATFSGGEPLAQPEFLLALLEACRGRGIHTAVDTSGFAEARTLDRVADFTDLFLYDIKLVDDEKHRRFTGVSNGTILANLEALNKRCAPLVIRFPLIPGVNDDGDSLGALGAHLSALASPPPVDILPYHRSGMQKYARLGLDYPMHETPPPSEANKRRSASLLKSYGLEVYLEGERYEHD